MSPLEVKMDCYASSSTDCWHWACPYNDVAQISWIISSRFLQAVQSMVAKCFLICSFPWPELFAVILTLRHLTSFLLTLVSSQSQPTLSVFGRTQPCISGVHEICQDPELSHLAASGNESAICMVQPLVI